MDSSLKNKWKMSQTKCNECFYKCYKIDDHESKHSCSYDHKCKEKCSFCIEFNCKKYVMKNQAIQVYIIVIMAINTIKNVILKIIQLIA